MSTPTTTDTTTRRRRGKKETSTPTPIPPAAPHPIPLEEQLRRAQVVIETNRTGTAMIHAQWRSQLSRISYLILAASLYHAYGPAQSCFQDVSAWNANNNTTPLLSPIQTALIVLADSLVFVLAISSALLLILFLHSPNRSFSNPLYLLANACMPAMLALRHLQAEGGNEIQTTCLETNLFLTIPSDRSIAATAVGERPTRAFPVVLIFHAIVTGSYWFIAQQSRHQEQNVEAVAKLRQDLKNGNQRAASNEIENDKKQEESSQKKKKNNSKKKK
jgi:hypothetical protein